MAKNSKPCPILNAVGIDEANSGAGIEICLRCPLPECIYDRKDVKLTWKQLYDFIEFLIKTIKEQEITENKNDY